MLNDIFQLFNSVALSERDEILLKANLFGLTEKKVHEKVAFGFFLDKASSSTIEPFKNLQFCAGSLTENFFIKILSQVLESKKAASLDKNTRQVISDYRVALKSAQPLNFFIDKTRSTNIFLCLFATTGNPFWGEISRSSFSKEEVDQTAEKIDCEVQSLKSGEKKIFMLGSLFHETRLYVERTAEDQLTFAYFDPAFPFTLDYSYLIPRTTAKGVDFWRPLCQKKYEKNGQYSDITGYLDKIGSKSPIPIDAILEPQRQNTCHFRSLLGPLKWQLHVACKEACIDFESEWKQCKYLIGVAIKNDLTSNPALERLAQNKLRILKKRSIVAKRLAAASKSDKSLLSKIDQLEKMLSLFYTSYAHEKPSDTLDLKKKLDFLSKQLERLLTKSAIGLSNYSAYFSSSPLTKAIFELCLAKSEKSDEILSRDYLQGKSIFIPGAESLLTTLTKETDRPLAFFLKTAILAKQPGHKSYNQLLELALDHYRLTPNDKSPLFVDDLSLLLKDEGWTDIANKCNSSKDLSIKELGFKITKALIEKKFLENPHRDWAHEIDALLERTENSNKDLLNFYLWKMYYQDGNFLKLSEIKLNDSFIRSNSLSLEGVRHLLTIDNYKEFLPLAHQIRNLPFPIAFILVRDIADSSFKENNSAIFLELIAPLETALGGGVHQYFEKTSYDSLRFLLKESLEQKLPVKTLLLFLRNILRKFDDTLFLQTVEPLLKKAIEDRFYGASLKLETLDSPIIFGLLPKGSWTSHFFSLISYLEEVQNIDFSNTDSAPIIERWTSHAPLFKALPETVQDDLLQAIVVDGANQRELSLFLEKLGLKAARDE